MSFIRKQNENVLVQGLSHIKALDTFLESVKTNINLVDIQSSA